MTTNKDIEKYIVNKKHYPNLAVFENIKLPEIAYFLGYFWADGHINKDSNAIKIVIDKNDAENVKEIFLKCGNWGIYDSKPRKNGKVFTAFQFCDYKLHNFLKQNDFDIKCEVSPTKILSKIPKKLHKNFWLGYFDGDGGFTGNSIAFTGTFSQKYEDLEKLCKNLNIKYQIYRRTKNGDKGKYSSFQICERDSILKICNYFYIKNKIFLTRKFENFINWMKKSNKALSKTKFYTYCKHHKRFKISFQQDKKIITIKEYYKTEQEAITNVPKYATLYKIRSFFTRINIKKALDFYFNCPITNKIFNLQKSTI